MIKKIFLFAVLLLAVMSCKRSPDDITPVVESMKKALSEGTTALMVSSNFEVAERHFKDVLRSYNRLSVKSRQQLDEEVNIGIVYYNLACAQSMQNRRRAAAISFSKFVESGEIRKQIGLYEQIIEDDQLDNIRTEKRYLSALEKAREEGDYMWILRKAGSYGNSVNPNPPINFQYADSSNPDLVRVRAYFNLDSIAGGGDELSQIKNLLYWAHNVVRHDGNSQNPSQRNAIDIVELCQKEDRGVNCRMMAQMLNECYLSMGFKSRFVTCMPKTFISDCHVINTVYSRTLDKWVWVDPTFNAYVTDEHGVMLGISEVRERMRDGRAYFLNSDANWNNQDPETKAYYLDVYMAKNLYYFICPDRSEFNTETSYEGKEPVSYVSLLPLGYIPDNKHANYHSVSESWFWELEQDQ